MNKNVENWGDYQTEFQLDEDLALSITIWEAELENERICNNKSRSKSDAVLALEFVNGTPPKMKAATMHTDTTKFDRVVAEQMKYDMKKEFEDEKAATIIADELVALQYINGTPEDKKCIGREVIDLSCSPIRKKKRKQTITNGKGDEQLKAKRQLFVSRISNKEEDPKSPFVANSIAILEGYKTELDRIRASYRNRGLVKSGGENMKKMLVNMLNFFSKSPTFDYYLLLKGEDSLAMKKRAELVREIMRSSRGMTSVAVLRLGWLAYLFITEDGIHDCKYETWEIRGGDGEIGYHESSFRKWKKNYAQELYKGIIKKK